MGELWAQQVIATQLAIDEELRIHLQLEARHQACQCKGVREFKCDISPYIVKEKVIVREEVDVIETRGKETFFFEEEIDLYYEICFLTGKKQPYRPGPGNSCEWMYGDAASGMLGFQALAGLNPLRWSGETTFNRAITHLRKVQKHNDRPIILKVPANTLGQELRFENTQDAIYHLMDLHRTLIGRATTYAPRKTGIQASDSALWVGSNGPRPTNPVPVETIRVEAGTRYPTTSVSAETIRLAGSRNPTATSVSAETVRVAAGSRIPTVTMAR